jgi:hypothetical protein
MHDSYRLATESQVLNLSVSHTNRNRRKQMKSFSFFLLLVLTLGTRSPADEGKFVTLGTEDGSEVQGFVAGPIDAEAGQE